MTNEELLEVLNKRFDAMETRMGKMETQMGTMEARLDGIGTQMSGIEARLDRLEEHAEITRSGVNSLLEWAEDVSNAIRFPLPKVK